MKSFGFVERNAEKLGKSVTVDSENYASPYVIGWGSGLVYEFNPDRARHQGLGVSVIAAVNQIRKPTRTSGPMYRRELWW
jgi:hypothetical protein